MSNIINLPVNTDLDINYIRQFNDIAIDAIIPLRRMEELSVDKAQKTFDALDTLGYDAKGAVLELHDLTIKLIKTHRKLDLIIDCLEDEE